MLTAEKKKYTVEDYMLLEEGAPFQLINNELIMSPSPTPMHQVIVARISHVMLTYLEEIKSEGYTAGSLDVIFDDNNVFQPDFLYVSPERVDEIIKDRAKGAPDMTIEILSPSNARYDLRQKKKIYEKYGVKEYIIFDPLAKEAFLYALKNGTYYLHQKAEKTGLLHSLVLPGFSFDLSYIFKSKN